MSFPVTNWTKLAEATLNGGEGGLEALGWICEKYQGPVDVVIRASGVADGRVEDVRQDFFVVLMKGGFFRRAECERGKFRCFLLNALKNFLVDDQRRLAASKRGGGSRHEELREDLASFEIDPIQFDLAWAEALFNSAIDAIGQQVEAKRGAKAWGVLREFLTGATETMSYADLSRALGLSEGGAKAEVSRLRAKFHEQLRDELWLTVSAPHEVDEELTYLRRAMSRNWGASNA